MIYRREIDGLRALAVLPVILFHAGIAPFSGGYVGVDIFFVISGYLITSILIGDLRARQFSILRFYERRARRILPALIVMMAVCLPLAWALLLPEAFRDFSQSLVAVTLFASNVLFWLESGYFAPAAELKPLLHTWSLAVEEQYYIVVPLILWAFWRRGEARLAWALALLAALSLAVCLWLAPRAPSANFYLLPSRAWELLAGSLCAFALRDGWRPKSELGALAGLGLIVAAVVGFDADTPFPSLWTLLPVGGTALIILCAQPGTRVAGLLSLPALVGVGLISYSAYLWHQPLFAFARAWTIFEPSTAAMLALSGLALGLGWLSWRFVEQPFRRPAGGTGQPWLASRRALFGTAAAASALTLAVGLAGSETRLHQQAWTARAAPETQRALELVSGAHRGWFRPWIWELTEPGDCVFLSPRDGWFDPEVLRRLEDCQARHGPGIAVLGDSHARDLFGMLALAGDRPFVVGFEYPDCHPGSGVAHCPFEAVAGYVETAPETFEAVAVMIAGFHLLASPGGGHVHRHTFLSVPLDRALPPLTADAAAVAAHAAYLQRLGRSIPVVAFGPRAEPHIPRPLIVRAGCAGAFELRPNQFGAYRMLEAEMSAALAGSPVRLVSQIDAMALDMGRDFMSCETLYWRDGDHFSLDGLHWFGLRVTAALDLALAADDRSAGPPPVSRARAPLDPAAPLRPLR